MGPRPDSIFSASTANLAALARRLETLVEKLGGCVCGLDATEMVRVEAGLPRFGIDMDETNLAPEAGIESRAISYSKGCYIGEEVIARIRTYGQVAKALCGLRFSDGGLPQKGDKLLVDEKEAGYVTSAVTSRALETGIGLGYVRREHNAKGSGLKWRGSAGEGTATVVELPFILLRALLRKNRFAFFTAEHHIIRHS